MPIYSLIFKSFFIFLISFTCFFRYLAFLPIRKWKKFQLLFTVINHKINQSIMAKIMLSKKGYYRGHLALELKIYIHVS